jgi:AcrR family transcriptional regulator
VGAAKAVFEEDGFLEARISDIAERAALSHGSFYHYFDSKEEIFHEVATECGDLLSAPLSTVIFDPTSAATPSERIREGIRRYLDSYRQEARIMGVIEQVSRYDERLNEVRAERIRTDGALIADSIRQLQRRGLVDTNLNPEIAATGLGAMTSRFAEMWLVQNWLECTLEQGADQLTRLFVNALGLRDTPADA